MENSTSGVRVLSRRHLAAGGFPISLSATRNPYDSRVLALLHEQSICNNDSLISSTSVFSVKKSADSVFDLSKSEPVGRRWELFVYWARPHRHCGRPKMVPSSVQVESAIIASAPGQAFSHLLRVAPSDGINFWGNVSPEFPRTPQPAK